MKHIWVIFLLVTALFSQNIFENSAQKDSSHYIDAIKDLVIATQKTRGLTNSFLNGNDVALLLVFENRDQMKKAIGKMESTALASNNVINTRATAITQQLIALNSNATRRDDAPQVFQEYTTSIEQLLLLAQTVNQQASKSFTPMAKDASGIMMETILPMTEYVGRFRGMGSGLVASHTCNKKQKIIMLSLANGMIKLKDKLLTQMQTLKQTYPKTASTLLDTTLQKIDKDTTTYIELTKQKVLQPTDEKLDPNAYFDQGTAIISLLINVYDALNAALLEDSKGWF